MSRKKNCKISTKRVSIKCKKIPNKNVHELTRNAGTVAVALEVCHTLAFSTCALRMLRPYAAKLRGYAVLSQHWIA